MKNLSNDTKNPKINPLMAEKSAINPIGIFLYNLFL